MYVKGGEGTDVYRAGRLGGVGALKQVQGGVATKKQDDGQGKRRQTRGDYY